MFANAYSRAKIKPGDTVVFGFRDYLSSRDNLLSRDNVIQKILQEKQAYLVQWLRSFKANHKDTDVYLLSDTPKLNKKIESCIGWAASKTEHCTTDVIEVEKSKIRNKIRQDVADQAGVSLLNFTDELILKLSEVSAQNIQSLYFNHNHLSQEGSELIKDLIATKILLRSNEPSTQDKKF